MPIERQPGNPLPQDYVPAGGVPYRVRTGDDWGSIARSAGLDVRALIEFNFQTRNPDEINWYLRRNVGCRKATLDGKNWMFSSDAQPGTIYLPGPSSSVPAAANVVIRSVKFWINAFIPRHLPGYTRSVPPGGRHAGKTMIPGPQSVRVPTTTPISPSGPFHPPTVETTHVGISDCYLTDQRDFSNDIHAKSRMHSEFRIVPGSTGPVFTQWHNCDTSTEVDCEDGVEEGSDRCSTTRMVFTLLPSWASNPSGPFEIEMHCAASNPLAPTSRLFGDIDYSGKITVAPAARSIDFDILIDAFPAFEAYATINDGAGVMMLQELPPPGNTVLNLPGVASRRFRRRLEDRNGDGIFEMLISI